MASVYSVSAEVRSRAHLDAEGYRAMYRRSLADPDGFWAEQAQSFISWFRIWDRVSHWDFRSADIRWFEGGELNASYNCLDRHLASRAEQTAIVWEGDDPGEDARISYRELHEQVCRFANVLKGLGVSKGDRVCIYLPMIPQIATAMLACARIGAIHSVVFGGLSAEALRQRIDDLQCKLVVTADQGLRGGEKIPLKANADLACQGAACVRHMLVVRRGGDPVAWEQGRDLWLHEAMEGVSADCAPERMDAEDPLFVLYTSGSTGKPKGVLHTTGGYLLYAAITHKYVFDYHDREVYWCTADAGWITGHTYVIYGPLANGATTVMFEGLPTHPDNSRFWQIVDKHAVETLYTAPTAIPALMRDGDEAVTRTSRSSLKLLGTVGEPINSEAWQWLHRVVGGGRCPIVDTWWQTETGGILITPLPGATALKPGAAARPFFGVEPRIVDGDGETLEGVAAGNLCMARSWPGQMRTVYGDHQRFFDTYFSDFPGLYFTGDGARRDEDGYYWLTGRMDDVIEVSGRRLGAAEIENAVVKHAEVAEAAVVAYPLEDGDQGAYVFVTLMSGVPHNMELCAALTAHVRESLGSQSVRIVVQCTTGLPKTRSGKIMRRILRKVAANRLDDLGDISTLADPAVVDALIAGRAGS